MIQLVPEHLFVAGLGTEIVGAVEASKLRLYGLDSLDHFQGDVLRAQR